MFAMNFCQTTRRLKQLENTASQEYVFHHIAALSDVHDKKGRKNPTGTVVASEKYLLAADQ